MASVSSMESVPGAALIFCGFLVLDAEAGGS